MMSDWSILEWVAEYFLKELDFRHIIGIIIILCVVILLVGFFF